MLSLVLWSLFIVKCEGNSYLNTYNNYDVSRGIKIYNGQNATQGAQPWMCSYQVWDDGSDSWSHTCGCVLINWSTEEEKIDPAEVEFKFLLTAGVCVDESWGQNSKKGRTPVRVVLGTNNVHDQSSDGVNYYDQCVTEGKCQIIEVEQAYLHPKFNYSDFTRGRRETFNIALLTLKEEVNLTDHVQPIEMAEKGFTKRGKIQKKPAIPDFSWCNFTGWGRTQDELRPTALRTMRVMTLPGKKCKAYYKMAPFNPMKFFISSEACAIDLNKFADTCQRDFGGPLVCQHKNGLRLYGVASWGIMACKGCFPNVHSRVSWFKSWVINSIIDILF